MALVGADVGVEVDVMLNGPTHVIVGSLLYFSGKTKEEALEAACQWLRDATRNVQDLLREEDGWTAP